MEERGGTRVREKSDRIRRGDVHVHVHCMSQIYV